jgi:hypothetical protein
MNVRICFWSFCIDRMLGKNGWGHKVGKGIGGLTSAAPLPDYLGVVGPLVFRRV